MGIRLPGPYKIKPAIPQLFDLPVPYDVLVAATEECLEGYTGNGGVEFKKVHETPGSTTYQLSHYQLVNLGTLAIRKLQIDLSEVYFSGPPSAASQRRKPTQEERAEIESTSNKDESAKTINTVNKKIKEESNDLYKRRKDHLGDVITAYLDRLSRENIWPKEQEIIEEQVNENEKLKRKFENLKGETQERKREMWEIMCFMDAEYVELALDNRINNPKPRMEDYKDRIIEEMGPGVKGTSTRTISEIRAFGKAGLLN